MPEFSNFKITEPLVLQKPFREHLKFFLKDFAAYFGINHRGWHDMRRYHYTPGQEQPHLQVARLSQQEIDFVIQRSDEYLEEYIRALDQYNDDVLAQTTQGLALPLLEEIMSKNPVHKRIIDIGACYTRVFRKISSKYPDYIWDMVDFPTTLATANEPVATSSMEFHSDYPLDYLEKTDHVYDIANINRTLAWMGVDQIGEYLSILRERARYVVFAEPCKLLFEPALRGPLYSQFLKHPCLCAECGGHSIITELNVTDTILFNILPQHFVQLFHGKL